MTEINDLRKDILKIITNESINIKVLLDCLKPISSYTNNKIFEQNIIDVVNIIVKDRDNDNKLTTKDIILLGKDICAMTVFITSILLILNSIPSVKITYTQQETEQLIFKIIIYIFFIIIPKQTGFQLTYDEKMSLLNISLLIYDMMINSQMLKNIIKEVTNWFGGKFFCKCFSSNTSPLDTNMPKVQNQLLNAMDSAKKIKTLEDNIIHLQCQQKIII